MNETRKGEIFIILNGIIYGLFPILFDQSLLKITPLWNAALCTLCAVPILFLYCCYRKTLKGLLNRRALLWSTYTALIITVCYYSLIFIATPLTSPQNAAVLYLLEVVTAIVFLWKVKHERLTLNQFYGAGLLTISAAVVVWPEQFIFNKGDILIIIAVCIPPFGNLFAKKARTLIASEAIILIRCLVGGGILALLALIFESTPSTSDLKFSAISIAINSILIFGISKILWNEGIARIPIAKANALGSIAVPVTYILTQPMLGVGANHQQLLALPLTLFGMYLLQRNK